METINNTFSNLFSQYVTYAPASQNQEQVQVQVQQIQQDQSAQSQPQATHTINFLESISNSKIIHINNELNGILSDSIKLPRIVVVGSQSSGKSTVLNNIITMNILPTGSEMVTRMPLFIEMSGSDTPYVEFGHYGVPTEQNKSTWFSTKIIQVTYPEPSPTALDAIKSEIESITNNIAGNEKGISHTPIILKIYLPNIPNLTLIDLPGITQIACRDKGQPDDIKEQIESLIGSYIQSPETIILSIIPARTDVEADVGIGLVKKYDPNFTRTIGVLTKIDLMNTDTDVSAYIKNTISKNLKMSFGYYLVKNRSNKEMSEITMQNGFTRESEFFAKHPVYSNMSQEHKKRMGISNLRTKLVDILTNKIRENMPTISKQINERYTNTCKELAQMGLSCPQDPVGKQTYMHNLILDVTQKFVHALDGIDNENYNTGRIMKDCFTQYKQTINNINPILEIDTDYINNIMKNIEGNHMTFLLPSIAVFEACINDKKHRPIQKLLNPSLECVKTITKQLVTLITNILKNTHNEIYRYPKLSNYLENKIINNIIQTYEETTCVNIHNLINMEESYIWTDSQVFQKNLSDIMNTKAANIESKCIKELLINYYDTIKVTIKNNIPKAIMYHLVCNMKNNILSEIMNNVDNNEMVMLLEEDDAVKLRRDELVDMKTKLLIAKQMIS